MTLDELDTMEIATQESMKLIIVSIVPGTYGLIILKFDHEQDGLEMTPK